VLQIAVNLVANARDSVLERCQRIATPSVVDAAPGRIAVRAAVDDGWLELAVEDDGGGIAPETLARIFNAGFTTKARGHGYGLHSSALAAEHLRGTLRCTSAGIDRGASFILRIPVETASSHD
ncbi:MAG TPA: ATP-binding protein, partial [Kofleriaceae bacterium]|nr:ATP-binding protein [Kofleriaceae bacterium]